MNLFSGSEFEYKEVKIHQGQLKLMENFIDPGIQFEIIQRLNDEIDWCVEDLKLFGKTHPVPRETAYYGLKNYFYSGKNHPAREYPQVLKDIINLIQRKLPECQFNSVLLNKYRNGSDKMGWHSDDETELGKNPTILSLSLGEERRFDLRHNETKEQIKLNLPSGSLLIMSGELQHHWKHQIPSQKRRNEVRINLTFRHIKA